MGFYDYVRCDVPLPDGGAPGQLFQTKDFEDPYLETYVISEGGRLIHNAVRYDIDPPGKVAGPRDTNYHGYLDFYDFDTATKLWREYRAKFTDGALVGIELVESRIVAPAGVTEGGDPERGSVSEANSTRSPSGEAL